jgi:hypothetical protein
MKYGEVLLVSKVRVKMFEGLNIMRYSSKMQLEMFEVDQGQSDCYIDLLSPMRKVLVYLLSTMCNVDISPAQKMITNGQSQTWTNLSANNFKSILEVEQSRAFV